MTQEQSKWLFADLGLDVATILGTFEIAFLPLSTVCLRVQHFQVTLVDDLSTQIGLVEYHWDLEKQLLR